MLAKGVCQRKQTLQEERMKIGRVITRKYHSKVIMIYGEPRAELECNTCFPSWLKLQFKEN